MVDQPKEALRPLTAPHFNQTRPNFTVTNSGFEAANPNVGTIAHNFTFVTDPWIIVATNNNQVCQLSQFNLSLYKVFNLDNSTVSYLSLSWTPSYQYTSSDAYVQLTLRNDAGGILNICNLGVLPAVCGSPGAQSFNFDFDPKYFDTTTGCTLSLGGAHWSPCG